MESMRWALLFSRCCLESVLRKPPSFWMKTFLLMSCNRREYGWGDYLHLHSDIFLMEILYFLLLPVIVWVRVSTIRARTVDLDQVRSVWAIANFLRLQRWLYELGRRRSLLWSFCPSRLRIKGALAPCWIYLKRSCFTYLSKRMYNRSKFLQKNDDMKMELTQ